MHLNLKLSNLARPSLGDSVLRRPLAALNEIKARNEERWGIATASPIFEGRKQKLRERLQASADPKKELKKIKKTEVGWQRLLLSLYIESNGQEWLPAFDDKMAFEVLGGNGAFWTASRRKQAVNFFFERFHTIPALKYLATELRAAFDFGSAPCRSGESAWQQYRKEIFQTDGHERIVQSGRKNQTLQQLMDRHKVPPKGEFSIKLRQVFLLETLQRCPLGEEPDVLHEIEKDREKTAMDSLPLGAAALRILVSRVENEGRGDWPDKWRKWIVSLGCDPRMGRQSSEVNKWWGWATNSQLNLAIQGMIGLELKIFFDFLDGTVSTHQWEERRQFLEDLLRADKIIDTRLVLNTRCLRRLPDKMRDEWVTAKLTATTEDTCIIALRCKDDVYIIEGTHNFALRAFYRTFPVKGFWERYENEFADNELRIHSPINIRHSGDWHWKFYYLLRTQFHVEWTMKK